MGATWAIKYHYASGGAFSFATLGVPNWILAKNYLFHVDDSRSVDFLEHAIMPWRRKQLLRGLWSFLKLELGHNWKPNDSDHQFLDFYGGRQLDRN